jgi:hypothetical protein
MNPRSILAAFTLAALLPGSNVRAEDPPALLYHSTLDSEQAIAEPKVGPAGQVARGGFVFAPAFGGANGLTAAAADWGGCFKIPAADVLGDEGTLAFWLKLRENFRLGGDAGMPVLLQSVAADGQKAVSALGANFDLRAEGRTLGLSVGGVGLGADIAHWRVGDAHHVALTWSKARGEATLYVDNVPVARTPFKGMTEPAFLGVNARLDMPGHQPNDVAVLSDLKIWKGTATDFAAAVPPELTAATKQRYSVQPLEAEKDAGLMGVAWRVEGDAASRVQLVPVGRNALAIQADGVEPGRGIVLRPAQPLPLAETAKWAWIWAHGHTLREVELSLLVRGTDGQERTLPVNIPRNHGWSHGISAYLGGVREQLPWMRPDQERAHPAGTDWPPPEALTGLVVTPSFGKGVAYLRDLRIDDTDFMFTPYWRILDFGDWLGPVGTGTPRLPLSSLLGRGRAGAHRLAYDAYGVPRTIDDFEPLPAGNYVVDVEVRSRYQGGVVFSASEPVAFDPDDVAGSFEQQLELPDAPGTYWLDATVRDEAGHYVYGRRLQVVVTDPAGDDAAPKLPEQPRLSHAGKALIALDSGRPDHIFDAPAAARVTARIRAPQRPANALRCEWTIESPQLAELVQGGQALASGGKAQDLVIECPATEVNACYDLTVRLFDGDVLLDRALLRVGRRVPEPTAEKSEALPDYRQVLFPGPTVGLCAPWLTHPATPGGAPPSRAEQHRLFEQSLDQAAEMAGTDTALVRLSISWEDFEPLPGLYCADALEQRLALARAKGLRVNVAFGGGATDGGTPPWLPHESIRGQYGLERHGTLQKWRYHAANRLASAWAPVYGHGVAAAFEALARRLAANPAVAGYHTWTAGALFDAYGVISDYSPWARRAFAAFLRDRRGLSLEDVNTRYGAAWKSWDEVQLPQAGWAQDGSEQSPAWGDFSAFKQQTVRHGLFDLCVSVLRRIGDPRPVTFYHENFGGNVDEYWPDCARLGAVPMGGMGNSPTGEYMHHVRAAIYGGVYSHEPHSASFRNSLHIAGDVLSGAFAVGGYGGKVFFYYHPRDMAANGKLRELVAGHLRALRERGASRLPPFDLAIYLPCKSSERFGGRSFGSYPHSGMTLGWEALHRERLLPGILTRFAPSDAWAGLKLVCVEDVPGMDRAEIERLTRHVREGGKLFLSSEEGRRVLDEPEADFALLRALGFPENHGLDYDTKGQTEIALRPPFFADRQTLHLRTGAPTADIVLPEGAEVLGTFADGRPGVVKWSYGQGEVVAVLGKMKSYLQPGEGSFLADLRRWAGIAKPNLTVTPNDRRVFASVSERDGNQYLAVFRSGPTTYGRDPLGVRADEPDEPLAVRVGLPRLAEGAYQVRRIGVGAEDLGVKTAAQLVEGIDVTLRHSELQTYAIEPAAGGGRQRLGAPNLSP